MTTTATRFEINPHILRYMEMVESGDLRACKEQHALCKLVRNAFIEEDIYTDNEQLEQYLGLSKYFGYDHVFEWQEFVFALHLCTYRREDGMPRWPDLFCMQGRGAGKDGTIAMEAMCLSSPYNGIKAYDVDICAINEEQATRPVKDIIEAFSTPKYEQKLKKHYYWTKEEVRSLKTGSVIKGRTNNPKGKDGLRSGAVIFNEMHTYEDYRNINVFTTGLGKKKHPRRSYYTTNGDVREGPLDDIIDRSAEILFGGEPDGGLLPFICKLDSKDEVHDPANWEKAVPGLRYLPSLREEMAKEYEEWKRSPARLPAFMGKRFNIPDGTSDIAVTDYDNIKATNKPLVSLAGMPCTVGIDYASLSDFASVDIHFKQGDMRYDINHTWVCRNSKDLKDGRIKAPLSEWESMGLLTFVDDVEIPPTLLTEYIRQAAERYFITGIGLDSFRYALMREALADMGFDPKERGNVQLIRPSDIMRIQPVIESCFVNGNFAWDNHPLLRWAANNTKLVRQGKKEGTDTGNFYYAKIEAKSRKTDPFMALVAAMTLEDKLPDTSYGDIPDLGVIIG